MAWQPHALLAAILFAPLTILVAPEDDAMRLTDTLPGSDGDWTSPTWIEGPGDTILMSFNYAGVVRIASSTDEGRTWEVFSAVEMKGTRVGGGYFTRLADGGLLLRISEGDSSYWVRSDDDGRTWSEPTAIASGVYAGEAPIRIMSDGRWAFTAYHQVGEEEFGALLLWSSDRGKTWSEPIRMPTPADGNKGLTECGICELGPHGYVMAIRADEGKQSWDGFYLSWSKDGLEWSTPVSLGERGRMPLFYRIGDLWALCYRLYDHALGVQHSAVRFSRDGREWSPPMIIEHGVDAAPFLIQVKGRIIAFNRRYPQRTRLTRHDITTKVRVLMRHAGTIPP